MTDNRFRRVATRRFSARKLDAHTAVELVAFSHLVEPYSMRAIFGWGKWWDFEWAKLANSEAHQRAAIPMIEANARALSVEAGLAILRAMRDGGWKPGKGRAMPPVVKDTLLELRARGFKGVDVAKLAGIAPGTLANWRSTRRASTARSRAAASLAL